MVHEYGDVALGDVTVRRTVSLQVDSREASHMLCEPMPYAAGLRKDNRQGRYTACWHIELFDPRVRRLGSFVESELQTSLSGALDTARILASIFSTHFVRRARVRHQLRCQAIEKPCLRNQVHLAVRSA